MDAATMQTIAFNISLIPAIVGVVEVLKDLGMPSTAAPAAAVLVGVVGCLAQYFAPMAPWIPYVEWGVSLGLSSVGLYTTAANVGMKALTRRPDPVEPPAPASS